MKRQQIDRRVEARVARLRAALAVQFEPIAQMQARRRRNILRGLLASASANGNGHIVLRAGRVRHAVPKM